MTTARRECWSPQANGTLMARTPRHKISGGVFWLVEPRRFELLTSCLQNGLISRRNGLGLGGERSASDRD